MAAAEPLLTPARVLEELQAVPSPDSDPQLTPDRLLRLAVAASQKAALSSRLELYPRGMAADRAVNLGWAPCLAPRNQLCRKSSNALPVAIRRPDLCLVGHCWSLLHDAGIDQREQCWC